MDGLVDLHIHSQHSDGSLTVEEVLALARERGMRAIALSDHDEVGGVEEAVELGARYGVEVLTAVEVSINDRGFEYHVLGYGIDPRHEGLAALLARGRRAREASQAVMVERLRGMGIAVTTEALAPHAHDRARGGWPLLNWMIDHGYVKDMGQYFDRYFAPGRPAHAEFPGCSLAESIAAIRAAKGVPVLAHPGHYERLSAKAALSQDDLDRFVAAGIEGIEAYAIIHTPEENQRYVEYARSRKLIVTGGSDCHGRRVGSQPRLGKVQVGYEVVRELRERLLS